MKLTLLLVATTASCMASTQDPGATHAEARSEVEELFTSMRAGCLEATVTGTMPRFQATGCGTTQEFVCELDHQPYRCAQVGTADAVAIEQTWNRNHRMDRNFQQKPSPVTDPTWGQPAAPPRQSRPAPHFGR